MMCHAVPAVQLLHMLGLPSEWLALLTNVAEEAEVKGVLSLSCGWWSELGGGQGLC